MYFIHYLLKIEVKLFKHQSVFKLYYLMHFVMSKFLQLLKLFKQQTFFRTILFILLCTLTSFLKNAYTVHISKYFQNLFAHTLFYLVEPISQKRCSYKKYFYGHIQTLSTPCHFGILVCVDQKTAVR